jgi:hypothetical protein
MKRCAVFWAAILAASAAPSCNDKSGGGEDVEVEYEIYEVEAPAGYAKITPNNAFEGSAWFVAEITTEVGEDFTGAQVLPPADTGAVHVVDFRCNNRRCGVVLSIDEYMDSTAQPIPRPIDSDAVQLRVEKGSETWEATLTVFPLEVSRSTGPSYPLMLTGAYMMSSFTIMTGCSLMPNFSRVEDLSRVSQLFVSGPIVIEGTVDFSGRAGDGEAGGLGGPSAGQGAFAGAAPQEAAGRGPGDNGVDGGGGGGGGSAEAGWAGTDGAGTGGLGGGTYGDAGLECARSNTAQCGGSGGGRGGDAGGGGGGGTIYLMSLDSIIFRDAVIRADGGDGAGGTCGGGGGSGGSIVLVAPRFSGNVTFSAAGGDGGTGSGGGSGGKGGFGRIRLDGNVSGAQITAGDPADIYAGPAVDRESLQLLDADGTAAVQGTCMAGAEVTISNLAMTEGGQVTATCSEAGAFSMDVPLVPGANELFVAQQEEGLARVYGAIGNTFDIAATTVRGSRLIVVSVPEAE